ncbi:hypothetical protein NIES2101_37400 [Calothrix sp. HK-06]|nr:hypothetical protein NIES2101_37400 [Calothrix sp. HK-06]
MKFTEPINDGLNAIAKQLEINRENREYDQLRGYMSDSEKIRLMKYELYSSTNARGDENHLQQLRQTIMLLSNEVERERKYQNSLRNQLHELSQLVIGLILLSAIGSYVVSGSGYCNNKNSKFCRDARIIPSAIEGYFHNELPLPSNENINIDQSN